MRARGQDDQRVETRVIEQSVERCVPVRRRDPKAVADGLGHRRRQVRDRPDLKVRVQSFDDRELLGLGHRAEAQDPEADAR